MESIMAFLHDERVQEVVPILAASKMEPQLMKWNPTLMEVAKEKCVHIDSEFVKDPDEAIKNLRDKQARRFASRPQGYRLYVFCNDKRHDIIHVVMKMLERTTKRRNDLANAVV